MAVFIDQKPENLLARACDASLSTEAEDGVLATRMLAERSTSEVAAGPQRSCKRRERHDEHQRTILQRYSAIARIPLRSPFAFGFDGHQNVADVLGDAHAAQRGSQQQLATEAPARYRFFDGKPRQQESWQLMARKPSGHRGRNIVMFDDGRRQTVEAKHPGRCVVSNRAERLHRVLLVPLPREPLQEGVRIECSQRTLAA